jgi:uncharacterized protein YhbP (UPF0306 family)
LREESTLSLATVDEHGQPCVAPLFYIADDEPALYWLSSETSLHSQNLKRTSAAAVTVYRHVENWKDIRGVQMRGLVTAITDQDRRKALVKRYRERLQLGTIFRMALSQCTLYGFRPDFFHYIDNSRRFGYRFELIIKRN